VSLVLKQVVELDNLGMAYACLRVSVLASRPCRLGLSRASVAQGHLAVGATSLRKGWADLTDDTINRTLALDCNPECPRRGLFNANHSAGAF
jgi:hypothetical protein